MCLRAGVAFCRSRSSNAASGASPVDCNTGSSSSIPSFAKLKESHRMVELCSEHGIYSLFCLYPPPPELGVGAGLPRMLQPCDLHGSSMEPFPGAGSLGRVVRDPWAFLLTTVLI